jgi:hypothetical protein
MLTAGIVLGTVGAAVLSRTLSSLLYGVGRLDPLTFLVVPTALLGVGLVASFVPALRASLTDPAELCARTEAGAAYLTCDKGNPRNSSADKESSGSRPAGPRVLARPDRDR